MSIRLQFLLALPAVLILSAASALAQNLPAIPPSLDPSFWGRPNHPYTLKLTITTTSADANDAPHPHVMNVFRDATGRVREEAFYDSGKLWTIDIRDPGKSTLTLMQVVPKKVFVLPLPQTTVPPPGKGWTVERLPARVIVGLPVEGFRFTRTIPASADGIRPSDTMIDDEWVSNDLGLVLEKRTQSPLSGTTITTVTHLAKTEPDPELFIIPADYSTQQSDQQMPHP